MSEKVTTKSTKNAIWEAYQNALQQLEAKNALVEDPTAKLQEDARKQTLTNAEQIVGMQILNPEITEQYKSLQEAISVYKQELEDIYDIKAKAESLTAIINAYNVKKVELDEKYKADVAAYEADLRARKDAGEDALAELDLQREKKLQEIEAEFAEEYAEMTKRRQRENEQYLYDIKRKRQKENDEWQDEKAAREAKLTEMENSASNLQASLDAKVEYMADLEAQVSAIPQQIAEAKAEAFEEGKNKAEKEYVFAKRAIEQKNAYELKAMTEARDRAEDALKFEQQKNAELQSKLDAAYTQMRDLASETVKSNGSVRILQSEASK